MKRFWSAIVAMILVACLGAVFVATARAFVPDGSLGWYWQMPQPVGTLYGVTFASPTDVWAVGAGGTILHSTDAGLTWSAQQSGTFTDLDCASFPDAGHGWVCGGLWDSANVLLATTNGGVTWSAQMPAGLRGYLATVSSRTRARLAGYGRRPRPAHHKRGSHLEHKPSRQGPRPVSGRLRRCQPRLGGRGRQDLAHDQRRKELDARP